MNVSFTVDWYKGVLKNKISVLKITSDQIFKYEKK